jgi:hypothetical protein
MLKVALYSGGDEPSGAYEDHVIGTEQEVLAWPLVLSHGSLLSLGRTDSKTGIIIHNILVSVFS